MHSYSVVLSLAVAAAPAWAQDSLSKADTLPLHRGQWAMQIAGVISLSPPPSGVIGIIGSTPGVGVLRFTSPRRAWSINFTLAGGHSHTAEKDTSGTFSSYTSNVSVTVRVGPRSYHAVAPSAALFHTLGVVGGFNHQCIVDAVPPNFCQNGWIAGVFGDFGGEYFPTRFLSLGAQLGATASYQRATARLSTTRKETFWSYGVAVTGVAFVATFHF